MEWDALVRRVPPARHGEVCARCFRTRLGGEYACPCGCAAYTDAIEPQDADRLVAATRRAPHGEPRVPVRGPLETFTPDAAGLLYHLWGGPGSGKTTIAYQAFQRPHIISAEMSLQRVAEYCARLGVVPASVSVPRWEELVEPGGEATGSWALGIPATHFGPVILDSATELGGGAEEAIRELHEHREATGAPCIIIGQATKAGDAWGSARLAHAVEVVVELGEDGGRRWARCHKNRAGNIGLIDFRLSEQGASVGSPKGWYSVEDRRGGGYRLVAWPDSGARNAGPFAAAERDDELGLALRDRLSSGGWATAYRPSRLAAGGWAAPEDVDARRAYAEASGLRWFNPRSHT